MIVKSIVIVFFVMSAQMAVASWHSFSFDVMGTRAAVDFWLADAARAKEIASEVEAEMRRIESVMSPYIDTSELSVVNSGGNAKHAMSISQELYSVIETAQRVSVISEGVFDVSFASVGFLYDYRNRLRPAAEQLERALQAVDYRSIDISTEKKGSNNRERYFIRFLRDDMRIDLGGIAKGYAVDRGMNILLEHGLSAGLVNAGGDSRIMGDRGRNAETGQKIPWVIGVRHPRDKTKYALRLPLSDTAISTSGDYERFFIDGNERVHHILNPSTGQSASGMASATVIGTQSILCDALATTVFASGVEKGLALIERFEGYDAVIIDLDGKVHYSAGFVAN